MIKIFQQLSTRTQWTLFLIAVVGLVFWPLLQAGYLLNFDDNSHVVNNSSVRGWSWDSAWEFFLFPDNANKTFIPLTEMTFFYENRFFSLTPAISHGINIILHTGVGLLLIELGLSIGLGTVAAGFAAWLFLIHPLHVEPVAWVTARKDVLYGFFYLFSLCLYCRYLDKGKSRDYIFALAAAGLSILAKPMALSLPLVLFLLDRVKGRTFSLTGFIDKMPFFLAVVPVAWVTYLMNAREPVWHGVASVLIWLWCPAFYLYKFLFPTSLSILYVLPLPVHWTNPVYLGSLALVVTALVCWWIFRRNKYVGFAAGVFVLSLFFLWRFDGHDLTIVADRFMYLPSIGFCFLFGLAAEWVWSRKQWASGRFLLITLMGLLMTAAFLRVRMWDNPFRLWQGTSVSLPLSSFVWSMRGESLVDDICDVSCKRDVRDRLAADLHTQPRRLLQKYEASLDYKVDIIRRLEAGRSFKRALLLNPREHAAWLNLGVVYTYFKRFDRALFYMGRALHAAPEVPLYWYNRGVVYEYMDNTLAALADYNRALQIAPDFTLARINRGNIYLKQGRLDEAKEDVWLALQDNVTLARTYDLAVAVARALGDEAMAQSAIKAKRFFTKEVR
jgi:hypothetical protein